MNVGDSGSTNELDIFGPPGTTHILASMRTYIYRYVSIEVKSSLCLRRNCHRDSIKIRAMDIPVLPIPPEPAPFFVDRNITAYVIPIFSSTDPAPEPKPEPQPYNQIWTPTELRKRKRSPSLNYARKRPSDETDSKGRPVLSDDMSSLIRKPDFRPQNLSGGVASEWRELVIRTMFPNSNLRDAPSTPSAPPNTYVPKDKRQKKVLFRPAFTKDLKIGEGRKWIYFHFPSWSPTL
jgi:ribonuclease Z